MKFRTNVSVLDQYSSSNISKIAFFLLGIILLSVSSKVSIPFYPVPMTFQTFVVYFIAASMGMIGFYSTLSYVILGLMGLPIFAAGGGIGYVSCRQHLAFYMEWFWLPLAIAYFSKDLFNKKIIKISLAVFVGALITFACGITHLSGFIGIEKAVMAGLMPFIYSELLKIALAIFAVYLLIKKN